MAVYADDFNKADSATVGAQLTFLDIVGDLQNVSNRAEVVVDSVSGRSRAQHDTATTNMYAEVVANLGTPTTSVCQAGPCLRYSSVDDTCYRLVASRGPGPADTVVISKIVTGTVTTLSSTSVTWAQGDTLRFEANGSTLIALQNGASRLSITDTAITTGTRGGIHIFVPTPATVTTTYIDSFAYGDLGVVAKVITHFRSAVRRAANY